MGEKQEKGKKYFVSLEGPLQIVQGKREEDGQSQPRVPGQNPEGGGPRMSWGDQQVLG